MPMDEKLVCLGGVEAETVALTSSVDFELDAVAVAAMLVMVVMRVCMVEVNCQEELGVRKKVEPMGKNSTRLMRGPITLSLDGAED